MAYFSVAPTLCEVTYDSNRDEKVTPYRYQCRSANSRATNGITSPSFTEIVNVSLPSGYNVSYYEYLRTLYDSRISSPTKASVGMTIRVWLGWYVRWWEFGACSRLIGDHRFLKALFRKSNQNDIRGVTCNGKTDKTV